MPLSLSSPPTAVQNDPEKWRVWRKLWLRIMLRWWLLVACLMVPWLMVMVLTFRFRMIPETVAVGSLWAWGALGIVAALVLRRLARRDLEDFERRELSEMVGS